MEEQRITYSTAKLAKEKGYKEYCKWRYTDFNGITELQKGASELFPAAPTQSLLQKWLREVHEIDIDVDRGGVRNDWYIGWRKFGYKYHRGPYTKPFTNYEEALEVGLKEALKLVP